ncbi:MAG: Mth938-like domain-containing protein [Thermodesulfobacteriota bacterium]
MRIAHYSFGRIVVDGESYTSDIIIYPDRVDSSWWRKEGHNLSIDDLKGVIDAAPQVLIIGTGYNGSMAAPQETVEALTSRGMELHVLGTTQAIELYNRLEQDGKVVAALHLTC